MAPTATFPAGNPPVRANQLPEPVKGKPALSAKSLREADAQLPERKRKIPPSADPPETDKKKKKKEKTRSPSVETKKKPLPLEHAWTPGDEVRILEADPPETDKKKKKKEKTRSPSVETKKKPLPLEHAWTPGDEVRILEADPPETDKKKEKTRSPSVETKKKPLPLEHAWTPGDEVRILEAMAAHRQDEQGKLPSSNELFSSLDGRLDSKGFGRKELRRKVRSLKRRHDDNAIKGSAPAEEHECRLYHLSKNVWDTIPEPVATSAGDASAMVPNARKTFDEMRQLYPCLAHEVVHIVDEPAVLERLLLGIDGSKARALNSKINDLRAELTEAITESAKLQNIEVPKVWQCPYNKLRPAKSRAAHESILYLDRLDKMHGMRDVLQDQLARMNREMVKMRQDIIASGPSPKVIRCESAESAPQSVVAEKQFSHNVMQRKIAAQEKLARGNNKEVTSKYRPPQNLSRKVISAPKRMPRARKEKMDVGSQILHDPDQRKVAGRVQQGLPHQINLEGGKQVILHSCVRPHHAVAKATLETCSPSTIVGGRALGPGCCQVLVNEVLDGKAVLIRPFGTMNTMAHTLGRSIAWIRENTRADTTAGMVAPNQPSPGYWPQGPPALPGRINYPKP